MALSLRLRHKGGQTTLDGVPEGATVGELQALVAEKTGIQERWQLLKVGFPPAAVSADARERSVKDVGVRNRDTVVVEERAVPLDPPGAAPPSAGDAAVAEAAGRLDLPGVPQPDRVGGVERHVIEADNSCLFNSVAYLVRGKSGAAPTRAQDYRAHVAAQITADPGRWDEITLAESEKPSLEYADWIQKSESWGGSLELMILSEHLGVQLSAVCVRSLRVEHFPYGGSHKHRAYLMYDGIHYDSIVGKSTDGSTELRVFDPADETTLNKVVELAREMKDKKQFVDTANFTLQCQHCFALFKGQADAQMHGKETGHFNFQEAPH